MIAKSNADIVKALRGFFDTHITSLNGVMEKLPDSLKAEFKGLRDSLNEQLSKLPALDQVPADAAVALNSAAEAIVWMQDYATNLMQRLTGLQKDLGAKVTSLNSLEEQVSSGALLTKEKAKEVGDARFNEGVQSVMPQITAMRKQQIELAGLPDPGDKVIALPQTDFDAQFGAAKANVPVLQKRGITKDGKGKTWFTEAVWLGGQEFAGKLTQLEELGIKESTTDPLMGGGGGGNNNPTGKRSLAVC